LSDAGRAAADGMMLGWVAVKVAATQVSVWSSRITARGLMLTAGYVAAASFLIYAGMTANRTFGMAPFPPRAESAKVDEPRDPSRRLAQAIAGSMGGAIAVDPGTGASTTSPGRVIQSVTEVPDPSAVPAIPAPESVIASLPSLDTPGRTQSAPDTEKTRPISPKNLATEADDLLSRGKVEETIVLIESRLQSIPAVSRPGLQTILARARHMQGERFLNQGKFTDAIKSYEAAVELEPKDANYRLYLGNAFYHYATRLKDKQEQSLPRFREAASSVEQATKLAPNNFFAHHRLALIYEALKRPQDARKAWQAVIKHAPAGSQSAQAADRALKRLPRRG
jgi:tetratricopeptide (TPR) repeat protein